MCLSSAVVSSSAGAPRQYHFVNQNLTEASEILPESISQIWSLISDDTKNDIEQAIKSSSDPVWIGLKSTDTWIWSLSDPAFYTARESQFRIWGSKQPNGDGDCVYLDCVNDLKGQWHDVDCSSTRHFICYNGSSKGFVSVQEKKNWTEAQKYCRQYHTDLASVRNQSENQQIRNITTDDQVWIGLHRLWVWSDNSTSTFTRWKPGFTNIKNNRNSICTSIVIRDEGRWTDEDCSNQRPFVCYD
ncbi:hypothetical protein cypCar_00048433, partial [Cyprinus carpio]